MVGYACGRCNAACSAYLAFTFGPSSGGCTGHCRVSVWKEGDERSGLDQTSARTGGDGEQGGGRQALAGSRSGDGRLQDVEPRGPG